MNHDLCCSPQPRRSLRERVMEGLEEAAEVAEDASNWKAGPHAPKGFDVLNRGKNQNARWIAKAIRALGDRP